MSKDRLTFKYRLIMATLRLWSLVGWPLRVRERQHLPLLGGALIVANHSSVLDITALALAGLPRHISFVARRSLADSRALNAIMAAGEVILIDPGASDRAALRAIVLRLQAGRLVAIFPEGTRSMDGDLQPFKGGAVLAARKAGVAIVPCGIRGAFEAWPRHRKRARRHPIEVVFGPPIDPSAEDLLEVLQAKVAELAEVSPPALPRPLEEV